MCSPLVAHEADSISRAESISRFVRPVSIEERTRHGFAGVKQDRVEIALVRSGRIVQDIVGTSARENGEYGCFDYHSCKGALIDAAERGSKSLGLSACTRLRMHFGGCSFKVVRLWGKLWGPTRQNEGKSG